MNFLYKPDDQPMSHEVEHRDVIRAALVAARDLLEKDAAGRYGPDDPRREVFQRGGYRVLNEVATRLLREPLKAPS